MPLRYGVSASLGMVPGLAFRAASLRAVLGFYGSIEVGNKSHLTAYSPMRRGLQAFEILNRQVPPSCDYQVLSPECRQCTAYCLWG